MTVGELKRDLADLPDDLPVTSWVSIEYGTDEQLEDCERLTVGYANLSNGIYHQCFVSGSVERLNDVVGNNIKRIVILR